MTARSHNKKLRELQKIIGSYIDLIVKEPALETVEKDFFSQNKLADALTILNVVLSEMSKEKYSIDKDYFRHLTPAQIEEHKDALIVFIDKGKLTENVKKILIDGSVKKYLFAYASRELNWVVISILSASYISANIIMRSLLELLIGISTNEKGSMNERISSISFLSKGEKEKVKSLWGEFCAWSHPFKNGKKRYVQFLKCINPCTMNVCVDSRLTNLKDY